jgi:hypothetical protein
MDRGLMELRSAPGEGTGRGARRQLRAAFRLANRDPTVKRLMLFEALGLTGLWLAIYLTWKSGSSAHTAGHVFEQWIYWTGGSGVATVSSVAIVCAVDAKIDGAEVGLRSALGEVRRRLPAILAWWIVSMAVALALAFGTRAVMSPVPALLVTAIIWAVVTFSVVPAIALGGGGALGWVGEAARLLRARWRRALAGLVVIGIVAGIAFIACGFALRATAVTHPRTTAESPWRVGGPLFLLYLAYALASATRGAFALILARDALGDLPGEPPAIEPRRRRRLSIRRIAFGAVAINSPTRE